MDVQGARHFYSLAQYYITLQKLSLSLSREVNFGVLEVLIEEIFHTGLHPLALQELCLAGLLLLLSGYCFFLFPIAIHTRKKLFCLSIVAYFRHASKSWKFSGRKIMREDDQINFDWQKNIIILDNSFLIFFCEFCCVMIFSGLESEKNGRF